MSKCPFRTHIRNVEVQEVRFQSPQRFIKRTCRKNRGVAFMFLNADFLPLSLRNYPMVKVLDVPVDAVRHLTTGDTLMYIQASVPFLATMGSAAFASQDMGVHQQVAIINGGYGFPQTVMNKTAAFKIEAQGDTTQCPQTVNVFMEFMDEHQRRAREHLLDMIQRH
jgi:hypothetical protein